VYAVAHAHGLQLANGVPTYDPNWHCIVPVGGPHSPVRHVAVQLGAMCAVFALHMLMMKSGPCEYASGHGHGVHPENPVPTHDPRSHRLSPTTVPQYPAVRSQYALQAVPCKTPAAHPVTTVPTGALVNAVMHGHA
jgi:hypothetical protein